MILEVQITWQQSEGYPVSEIRVTDRGDLVAYRPDGGMSGYAAGKWEYFELTEDDE